jgi:nitrogen fixation NifU-like protein
MYTDRLLEHYRSPQFKGRLQADDRAGHGRELRSAEEYNPLCGDRIAIQVQIQDGTVAAVRWDGRGCALCLGAADILAESVQGRSLTELADLGQEQYLAELESAVRPSRLKCALLPWMTLRHALFGEDEWPLLER